MKTKNVTYFFHEESETWYRLDDDGETVFMLNETVAKGKIKQILQRAWRKEFNLTQHKAVK